MGLKVTGSSTSSERPYPALDIIEFFKTRSALVVAAVAVLDAMSIPLAALKTQLRAQDMAALNDMLPRLEALVQEAAIGDDNLLVANPASIQKPFVMCAVNRQPSGAVDVRTIELDRDALALAGFSVGDSPRPLDALVAAVGALVADPSVQRIEAAESAVEAVSAQIRISVSRLSIIKARLDLQQSFLASVLEPEAGVPLVRLDSHLNAAGVRDMALEAGRLLSSRSLNIASGNRKTLTSLFEQHAASVA